MVTLPSLSSDRVPSLISSCPTSLRYQPITFWGGLCLNSLVLVWIACFNVQAAGVHWSGMTLIEMQKTVTVFKAEKKTSSFYILPKRMRLFPIYNIIKCRGEFVGIDILGLPQVCDLSGPDLRPLGCVGLGTGSRRPYWPRGEWDKDSDPHCSDILFIKIIPSSSTLFMCTFRDLCHS